MTPAFLASSPRLLSAAEGSGKFVDITVHNWQWIALLALIFAAAATTFSTNLSWMDS